MAKTQLNIRLPELIIEVLDKQAEQTGKTKTEIVHKALALHLGIDTAPPELSDIVKRLERLEAKFQQTPPPAQKTSSPELSSPDEYGELITKAEASELTGYTENYFSGIFHRKGISEISKRGKAGLYSKTEILERIGYKR